MLTWLKRLLGCDRRAAANNLHVFAWRVRRAETAEELLDIAGDAIRQGFITEVEKLLDQKERETQCQGQ